MFLLWLFSSFVASAFAAPHPICEYSYGVYPNPGTCLCGSAAGPTVQCNSATGFVCDAVTDETSPVCSAEKCEHHYGQEENERTCLCDADPGSVVARRELGASTTCTEQTGLVCDSEGGANNAPSDSGGANNAPRCGCTAGRYLLIKNDAGGQPDPSTGYCASCPDGYRSKTFALACNNDLCPAGTYTDREACLTCPQGFYQDQAGQAECPYCPSGYVKADDSQSCQIGCEIGSYTLNGTKECGLCPHGEYQDQTNQSSCKNCDRGYFLSDNSKNITPFTTARHDNRNDCFLCAAGMFSDAGFQFCIMCPSGWHQKTMNASTNHYKCVTCAVGKFGDKAGAENCKDCPVGFYQNEQTSSFCLPCRAGYYENELSSSGCANCTAGKYRINGNAPAAHQCNDCPIGFYQNEQSSSFCLPCRAGYYENELGSSGCAACAKGRYRISGSEITSSDGKSSCVDCPAGFHTDSERSPACNPCSPGRFAASSGLANCKKCDAAKYTAGYETNTPCEFCPSGYDTQKQTGSDECKQCSLGQYGTVLGTCEKCSNGTYTDVLGSTKCKTPKAGQQANEAQTGSIKVSWKTPQDCDSNKQYLNDTSNNHDDWECADCPTGGDCSGPKVWSTIKPLNGYWRVSSLSRTTVPSCYTNYIDTEASIVISNSDTGRCPIFIKCLFGPACLGAPNPILASELSGLWPDAINDHNESCNVAKGFEKSSRMCQTCARGYSRSSRSRCVKCGALGNHSTGNSSGGSLTNQPVVNESTKESLTNILLLFSVGFITMVLFFSALVGVRVKAFRLDATSKRRKRSIHSTMKRVLLSHMQMLNTIIHLTVPWPRIIVYILDNASAISGSFGESTTNTLECMYEEQSHSDFYLGALIVVALAPFLFVGLLAIYWYCFATRVKFLGCGQKIERINKEVEQEKKKIWKCHHANCNFIGAYKEVENHEKRCTHASSTIETIVGTEYKSSSAAATAASSQSIKPQVKRARRSRRSQQRPSEQHRKFRISSMDALIMSAVLFWFMLLPSILRFGFVTLECIVVPDMWGTRNTYMIIDLEQPCFEGRHVVMCIIALPLVLFHIVVVPLGILLTLHKAGAIQRESDPVVMFRWGLIHSGYRTSRFWWEFVVLIRKTCLILISTFAATDKLQLHLSLAVLIVSLHLHDTNRPFGKGKNTGAMKDYEEEADYEQRLVENENERALHLYEMLSLLCLLFLIWSGVLFYFEVCTNSQIICTILIVAIFGTNATYLLVLAQRCVREWGKRNHKMIDKMQTKLHLGMSFDKTKKKKKKGGKQEMEMQDLVPVTVNAIPNAEKKEEAESCTVELFL